MCSLIPNRYESFDYAVTTAEPQEPDSLTPVAAIHSSLTTHYAIPSAIQPINPNNETNIEQPQSHRSMPQLSHMSYIQQMQHMQHMQHHHSHSCKLQSAPIPTSREQMNQSNHHQNCCHKHQIAANKIINKNNIQNRNAIENSNEITNPKAMRETPNADENMQEMDEMENNLDRDLERLKLVHRSVNSPVIKQEPKQYQQIPNLQFEMESLPENSEVSVQKAETEMQTNVQIGNKIESKASNESKDNVNYIIPEKSLQHSASENQLRKHRKQPRLLTSPPVFSSAVTRLDNHNNFAMNRIHNYEKNRLIATKTKAQTEMKAMPLSHVPLVHECVHCRKPNILQNDMKYLISQLVASNIQQSMRYNFNQLFKKNNIIDNIENRNLQQNRMLSNQNVLKLDQYSQTDESFLKRNKNCEDGNKKCKLEIEITSCIQYPECDSVANNIDKHENKQIKMKNGSNWNQYSTNINGLESESHGPNQTDYVQVPASMLNIMNNLISNLSQQISMQQISMQQMQTQSPITTVPTAIPIGSYSNLDYKTPNGARDDAVSQVSTLHFSDDDD